jgi:hypothetical protein
MEWIMDQMVFGQIMDQMVFDQQKTAIRCQVCLTAIVTTMGFPRRPLTLRLL